MLAFYPQNVIKSVIYGLRYMECGTWSSAPIQSIIWNVDSTWFGDFFLDSLKYGQKNENVREKNVYSWVLTVYSIHGFSLVLQAIFFLLIVKLCIFLNRQLRILSLCQDCHKVFLLQQ